MNVVETHYTSQDVSVEVIKYPTACKSETSSFCPLIQKMKNTYRFLRFLLLKVQYMVIVDY